MLRFLNNQDGFEFFHAYGRIYYLTKITIQELRNKKRFSVFDSLIKTRVMLGEYERSVGNHDAKRGEGRGREEREGDWGGEKREGEPAMKTPHSS